MLLPEGPPGPVEPVGYGRVLFVGLNTTSVAEDAAGRAALERTVRALVERQYAREGMPDVDYDLQLS